jgi:hypothetical protein
MSYSAMGEDGNIHYAGDLNDPYKGNYFCPNEMCHVKMSLKNPGPREKQSSFIRPYFSASAKNPHIEGCEYEKSAVSDSQLKESGFRLQDFFFPLLYSKLKRKFLSGSAQHKTSPESSHRKSITTVGELYHYCLQHADSHKLPDGTKVWEIYQEKRNEKIWDKTRQKARLIKLNFINCNFGQYDEKLKCFKIWCIFPHTETTVPPGRYYWLGFAKEDLPLMHDICRMLYLLKKRNGFVNIVAAGAWEGNLCYVKSKKQLFIINYSEQA